MAWMIPLRNPKRMSPIRVRRTAVPARISIHSEVRSLRSARESCSARVSLPGFAAACLAARCSVAWKAASMRSRMVFGGPVGTFDLRARARFTPSIPMKKRKAPIANPTPAMIPINRPAPARSG